MVIGAGGREGECPETAEYASIDILAEEPVQWTCREYIYTLAAVVQNAWRSYFCLFFLVFVFAF